MTIRTRLTLWYAGVLFVCLLLFGLASYYELVVERRPHLNRRARQAAPAEDRIAVNAKEERWIMIEIGEVLLWVVVPATLFGLAGGAFLTHKFLAPVSVLARAAERISEHNLKERLSTSGNGDELDRLTGIFNAMIARLDNAFQRVREFSLHASHELKTPLTILHAEVETALEDESLSQAHRERLASQLGEIERLARLVDGLTLMTRADAGLVELAKAPLRLDELVQESFADVQILSRPAQLDVSLDPCEPCTVLGDRHRLRQLLLNLADNAVKYNIPAGSIRMSLRRNGDAAEYTISNTGPGISESDRPHVFEPFYRSRSNPAMATEGSGLGLCIAQWIVHAHRGAILLFSRPDNITCFTVRLPLAVQPGAEANAAGVSPAESGRSASATAGFFSWK